MERKILIGAWADGMGQGAGRWESVISVQCPANRYGYLIAKGGERREVGRVRVCVLCVQCV